eukprot:scaffold3337_cov169-Amphora_coffeaeformis.AAC.10
MVACENQLYIDNTDMDMIDSMVGKADMNALRYIPLDLLGIISSHTQIRCYRDGGNYFFPRVKWDDSKSTLDGMNAFL